MTWPLTFSSPLPFDWYRWNEETRGVLNEDGREQVMVERES